MAEKDLFSTWKKKEKEKTYLECVSVKAKASRDAMDLVVVHPILKHQRHYKLPIRLAHKESAIKLCSKTKSRLMPP